MTTAIILLSLSVITVGVTTILRARWDYQRDLRIAELERQAWNTARRVESLEHRVVRCSSLHKPVTGR